MSDEMRFIESYVEEEKIAPGGHLPAICARHGVLCSTRRFGPTRVGPKRRAERVFENLFFGWSAKKTMSDEMRYTSERCSISISRRRRRRHSRCSRRHWRSRHNRSRRC
jgi:hypothetical protein